MVVQVISGTSKYVERPGKNSYGKYYCVGKTEQDMGFRYVNDRCMDASGNVGLNGRIIGTCAKLDGLIFAPPFQPKEKKLQGAAPQVIPWTEEFNLRDLRGSSFKGSAVYTSLPESVDFRDTDFTGAKSDSDAVGGDFRGAKFTGAVLATMNFENANLSGVDLSGVKLYGCVFSHANMTNVKFDGSDLQEADLRSATVDGATFWNAIYTWDHSYLPFDDDTARNKWHMVCRQTNAFSAQPPRCPWPELQ